MTNKPKRIGTAAETAVTRWLQGHGFPDADRRALAGSLDRGDILLCPSVIAEVKAGQSARAAGPLQVEHWLQETETERVNANAMYGVLIVQRLNRHRPGPAGWQAWVPFWSVNELLRGTTFLGGQAQGPLAASAWSASLHDVALLLRHGGYGHPIEGDQ